VRDREVEVMVAQVPGISELRGVNLFAKQGQGWVEATARDSTNAIAIPLEVWQLPEVLGVLVVADADAPDDPTRLPNPFLDGGAGIAVPVVPDMC
jgi:hypothetical protein